jgi:glycosyltransferase involved in cell wall biosynthesis
MQSRVARSARSIIVPSEYLKGVVAAWGISREKIEVIYNSVPVEELGTVPGAVKHLPRPVAVSVGRLVPWKGMDGIIDAVAMLREQKIGASLVIAGDGPERVPLVAHAEEVLKGGYIFTGALSHADTLALMKCADVLVLNSSYEGLSHLLIEALQVGAPIVATNVGGNPEMITDGQEGLLVPFGDAPVLVEAVARVLSDEKLRLNLSMHARESASIFSTETMLDATAKFFQNL